MGDIGLELGKLRRLETTVVPEGPRAHTCYTGSQDCFGCKTNFGDYARLLYG